MTVTASQPRHGAATRAGGRGQQRAPAVPVPGDQELQHHVQPHVLHLHPQPEGHGLQGEPEEVPLARPQPVERPEDCQEGEG